MGHLTVEDLIFIYETKGTTSPPDLDPISFTYIHEGLDWYEVIIQCSYVVVFKGGLNSKTPIRHNDTRWSPNLTSSEKAKILVLLEDFRDRLKRYIIEKEQSDFKYVKKLLSDIKPFSPDESNDSGRDPEGE